MQRFSNEVVVIGSDGEKLGQMHFRQAMDLARDAGLDLVEVSKQGANSVCKIVDRGKWEYEQKKKAKVKKQNTHRLKEIKFGLRIEPHDRDVKVNHIQQMLDKGYDVCVAIEMKGRERANPQVAATRLNEILKCLQHEAQQDSLRKSTGQVSIIIKPKKVENHASQPAKESE
jgi:translation initiation factor IF-3